MAGGAYRCLPGKANGKSARCARVREKRPKRFSTEAGMSHIPIAWRLLPLIGVVLLVAIPFGWRSWLQRRRHGTRGIFLFRSKERGQIVRDSLLLLVLLLLAGQAVVAVVAPDALRPVIAASWLRWAGAVLLFGGLILLVAAQL